MHHLLAYNSTLAAVAGLQQVNAIADPVFPRSNGNTEYQISRNMRIAAAFAGAAANVRTRIITPTLQLRGEPQVVPISGTLLPAVDPNFMDISAAPIGVKTQESIRIEMESNSATDAFVGLWMFDEDRDDFKVAYRDLRWLRATFSVTTVVRAWALGGALAFDETLEAGQYAVYGMQAFFATSLAARIIFPNQVYRPGCLGQATAVSRSAPLFWGGMGLFGKFDSVGLPQVEVLDTAAATVTYTVWLLCGKAGEGLVNG